MAAKSKVKPADRARLTERIETFEKLIQAKRAKLMGPGGGHEVHTATVSFALHMLRTEASRILGISDGTQDGTKRGRRKDSVQARRGPVR